MHRISSTQTLLKKEKVDALIVTNPTNILYLTNFKGVSPAEREALLIVHKSKPAVLITAQLYRNEAFRLRSANLDIQIAKERNDWEKLVKDALPKSKKIGFEGQNLTYAEYKKYKKYFKGSKFIPTKNLIENLRQIKSETEIKYIETAQKQTQAVFERLVKTIRVGQTELEIKENLEKIAKTINREPLVFDPIVASGPNSSLPHYATGNRKIKKGDALLFDFGLKYRNYCADFSRTIFVKRASDEQKNIYTLVAIAQKLAIAQIKPKIPAKNIWKAANNLFKKNNLDDKFIHSLGHGIGLAVHETPSLYKKSKDKILPGMVFSVEPGLYLPWGGIRIEDLVAIKNNKVKTLGKSHKFIETST